MSCFQRTYAAAASLIFCGLSYAISFDAHAERFERIKQTETIRLGYRESSVPFSFKTSNQAPQGYSIDLCMRAVARIERAVGRRLQVIMVPVTSANRIDALANGQVDIECGSTTNNAARRQRISFAIPHYITGARILTRKTSEASDLEGLRKRKVALTKGSTSADLVRDLDRRLVLQLDVVEVDDHAKAVDLVSTGQVDAFVMDEILLLGLTAVRSDRSDLKIVGRYMSVEPLALGLPKDSPALKNLVDEELAELMRSGRINEIYDKWFDRPIAGIPGGLAAAPNRMTREVWRYPSDFVPF